MHGQPSIRQWTIILAIAVAGAFVPSVQAQFFERVNSEKPTLNYTFAISPQSPQPPIMKHRLYPSFSEQVPGNAAPLYHRGILLMSQRTAHLKEPQQYWDQIDQWRLMPLADLPQDEVEEVVETWSNTLQEASFAARRSSCDWNLPIPEHGTDVYTILLPEIQEMRTVARLLTLRIRLRLAQERLDEAIADLQTGYAMARHVGNRDFIVNALVGAAIERLMHEQLLTALSVESTPNLYWSIVNQPNPLIDIRNAIDVERDNILTMFPELTEAQKDIGGQAYWNPKLLDVMKRSEILQATPEFRELDLNSLAYRTAVFSQADRVKSELVDKFGYDQSHVAAMPGSRAILLYSLHHYYRVRDDWIAPLGLPYYQARQFYPQDDDNRGDVTVGDPLKLAAMLLPSIGPFQEAAAGQQRWRAMLLTVEAIRDYAAQHGELPESLSAVGLPIPNNPYDNQPLAYQRSEDQPSNATLKGASPNLPVHFHITLRKLSN